MDGSLTLALDAASLERLADLVAERLAARSVSTQPAPEPWIDTATAAGYLGVSPSTLRGLAASGEVASVQDSERGRRRYRRCDLDAWRMAQ